MKDSHGFDDDDVESGDAFPRERRLNLRGWAVQHAMAVFMVLTIVVALLSEMPWIGRAIRGHLLQFLVIGFFAFIGWTGRSREDLRRALRRGPAPWMLALVAWCAFLTVLPPTRDLGFGALLRPFGLPELLRTIFCVGVFLVAAYGLPNRDLGPIVIGTLSLGVGVALYGLIQYGNADYHHPEMTSIFGNHEQVGSFLMLMLPIALAFAIERASPQWLSISAQISAVIIGSALLLSRTRSAWIGEAVGILALLTLWGRNHSIRIDLSRKDRIVGPPLILAAVFAILVTSSAIGPLVSRRVSTFASGLEDVSFADRLHRWEAACRMAYERPITGWGLGAYPVLERHWTGTGDPPEWVLVHGTGHSNLAHDFWVQWAAETGATGLIVYVAVIVCFLLCVCPAVAKTRPGFPRTLLIGCIAATVGACGDMIGAPSYTYPGVSSLPWLWMGLGLAACRMGRQNETDPGEALPPTPRWIWGVSLSAGLAVAFIVLCVGARHPSVSYRIHQGAASSPSRDGIRH